MRQARLQDFQPQEPRSEKDLKENSTIYTDVD